MGQLGAHMAAQWSRRAEELGHCKFGGERSAKTLAKEWQLVSATRAGNIASDCSGCYLFCLIHISIIFQSYIMGNCASEAVTCGCSSSFEYNGRKESQDKKGDEKKPAAKLGKKADSVPEGPEGTSHCTQSDGE